MDLARLEWQWPVKHIFVFKNIFGRFTNQARLLCFVRETRIKLFWCHHRRYSLRELVSKLTSNHISIKVDFKEDQRPELFITFFSVRVRISWALSYFMALRMPNKATTYPFLFSVKIFGFVEEDIKNTMVPREISAEQSQGDDTQWLH